ncbi:MAG: hypothetical protein IIC67_03170 [Thaumarchaeota archaeon]|nr:hypothetical protein [Nitrososphaerota archaeon]
MTLNPNFAIEDFTPKFINKQVRALSDGDWLTFDEPQVIFFQGQRGSGKSVSVNTTAEKLYNAGYLVLHVWAARSFENLYWCINKNCGYNYSRMKKIAMAFFYKEHSKNTSHIKSLSERCRVLYGMNEFEFDKYILIMKRSKLISKDESGYHLLTDGAKLAFDEFLHCKCDKAYPILWVVPDYINLDQRCIDNFNGVYWNSFEDYDQDYCNRKKKWIPEEFERQISELEFNTKYPKGLKKPDSLIPKPLIIVKHITTPTTAVRKEVFKKQWISIMLQAREERRVVVMNPEIFVGMDKFDTVAEIFKNHRSIMNSTGHFNEIKPSEAKNPEEGLTQFEKTWDRVAIIVNEVRSIAPSSALSGEKDAGKSKRAIFDYVPEARHSKTHLILDYQNSSDLFAGIRHQANLIIIKRSSVNLLGADNSWIMDRVEIEREKMVRKYGFDSEAWSTPGFRKEILDKKVPRVGALEPNKGYVTYTNHEIKLQSFDMPRFHHKSSSESFLADTGITWTVDKKITEKIASTKSDEGGTFKQRKKLSNEIYEQMYVLSENMKNADILEKYQKKEEEGSIPDIGLRKLDVKKFTTKFSLWKKNSGKKK